MSSERQHMPAAVSAPTPRAVMAAAHCPPDATNCTYTLNVKGKRGGTVHRERVGNWQSANGAGSSSANPQNWSTWPVPKPPVECCDRAARMDLIMSVLVTENRRSSPQWPRHRFQRLDVFMYSMWSYASLPIRNVHVFAELDGPLVAERFRVLQQLKDWFGPRLVTFRHFRPTMQPQWRSLMRTMSSVDRRRSSPSSREEATTGLSDGLAPLVWFLQNDDHPFIDVDASVLCDGLSAMHEDPAPFKSLWPSHWSFALATAARFEPIRQGAGYVRSELTMLDALQVFSLPLLRYVLLEVDWNRRSGRVIEHKTIDNVVKQQQVVGGERKGNFAEWRNTSLQTVYVPLRELCRKFDGLGDKLRVSPPLVLPPQANTLPRDTPRNRTRLLPTMLCRSDTCVRALLDRRVENARDAARATGGLQGGLIQGTALSPKTVTEWVESMLALYARAPTPDDACVPRMTISDPSTRSSN